MNIAQERMADQARWITHGMDDSDKIALAIEIMRGLSFSDCVRAAVAPAVTPPANNAYGAAPERFAVPGFYDLKAAKNKAQEKQRPVDIQPVEVQIDRDGPRHRAYLDDGRRCWSFPEGGYVAPDAVTRVEPGAVEARAFARRLSSEPMSWADLQTPAAAQAFLLAASAAELDEMVRRLLAGKPLSPAEEVAQRHIALALCASEALSRRVFRAVSTDLSRGFRLRLQGFAQGNLA